MIEVAPLVAVAVSWVFPADFPVRVLLDVEVVERANARDQGMPAIAEHRHEAGVPLENVLVESGVNEL